MAWDDFGFSDFGGGASDPGFSFAGYNPDWGSSTPSDYSVFSDFGGGASDPGTYIPYGGFGNVGNAYYGGNAAPTYSDFGGGASDPGTYMGSVGAAALTQDPRNYGGGGNIFGMSPGVLSAGLGGLGALAGLAGTLAGGGVQQTQQTRPTTAQKAIGEQAQQGFGGLGQFALGQSPLQQAQAQILLGLAQGQIPQNLIDLVSRSYDPQIQGVVTRARQASQRAGFHDAPLSAPPGGAIAGPALAQLQGQQANSILGLMQSLPQLYNQPVSQQINAQQNMGAGFGNLFNQYMPTAQTQVSQPLGPQIGRAIGGGLQGIGQSIQQNQQQQSLDQLLRQMQQGQGGISMSGARY